MNKLKLRNLLNALSPDGTSVDFAEFDANVAKLKEGLKQKIQVKTLDDVNTQLRAFKRGLDFTPLFTSIENIEKNLDEKIMSVSAFLESETTDFQKLIKENNGVYDDKIFTVSSSVQALRNELNTLNSQKSGEVQTIKNRLEGLTALSNRIDALREEMQTMMADEEKKDAKEMDAMMKKCTDEMEKMRRELTNRINNLPRGGGNANRNIAIGGNTSVLSTFTDINLKAGANVTITYVKNQTTKYTDVTITSTGGSGTIRSINSISTDTTAGATAGTDYVYLVSGTTTLTIPTAVANTNQYTVKNVGSGIVTIATTGAETIDGNLTITMPVQFTSVDLISDGTNWNIT